MIFFFLSNCFFCSLSLLWKMLNNPDPWWTKKVQAAELDSFSELNVLKKIVSSSAATVFMSVTTLVLAHSLLPELFRFTRMQQSCSSSTSGCNMPDQMSRDAFSPTTLSFVFLPSIHILLYSDLLFVVSKGGAFQILFLHK